MGVLPGSVMITSATGGLPDAPGGFLVQGLADEAVVATVMADVLEALEYLHERGRIHRDVKVCLSVCLSCVS
jgi:serine/threonine protein kinase